MGLSDHVVSCFWRWVFRRLWVVSAEYSFSLLLKITWPFFLWETNLLLLLVPVPGLGKTVARPSNNRVPFLFAQCLDPGWQYNPKLGQWGSISLLLLAFFPLRHAKLWACNQSCFCLNLLERAYLRVETMRQETSQYHSSSSIFSGFHFHLLEPINPVPPFFFS